MENPTGGAVVQRTVEETRVTPPPDDPRIEQANTNAQAATTAAQAAATAAAQAQSAAERTAAALEATQAQLAQLAEQTSAISKAALASTPTTSSSDQDGGAIAAEEIHIQQPGDVEALVPPADATEEHPEGEPSGPIPWWRKVLLSE